MNQGIALTFKYCYLTNTFQKATDSVGRDSSDDAENKLRTYGKDL
jgi:hypothetical protein